jgi:hypothetical protein
VIDKKFISPKGSQIKVERYLHSEDFVDETFKKFHAPYV